MSGITTVTTITLALDAAFPPPDYDVPEPWLSIFTPLDTFPGFYGAVLGRGVEHPDKGIIIVAWKDDEHLLRFNESDVGKTYAAALAGQSRTPPHVVEALFYGLHMPQHKNYMHTTRSEFYVIDFPRGHRSSIGSKLRQTKGMVSLLHTAGIDGSRPEVVAKMSSASAPFRGWVTKPAPGDPECDQAIWIHTWVSEEKERRFKETEARTSEGRVPSERAEGGVLEEAVPVEQHFEEELRRMGARRIVRAHYDLRRFPML